MMGIPLWYWAAGAVLAVLATLVVVAFAYAKADDAAQGALLGAVAIAVAAMFLFAWPLLLWFALFAALPWVRRRRRKKERVK